MWTYTRRPAQREQIQNDEKEAEMGPQTVRKRYRVKESLRLIFVTVVEVGVKDTGAAYTLSFNFPKKRAQKVFH